MTRLLLALTLALTCLTLARPAQASPEIQALITENIDQIERPSRRTIAPLIEQIAATGPDGLAMLAAWSDKRLGLTEDGRVVVSLSTSPAF